MKKFTFWMGMTALAVLFPSSAFAATAPADPIYSGYDTTFYYSLCCDLEGPSFASVHSWVTYNGGADTYRYHYQIQDVSEDYKIHYFQFDIPETLTSEFSNINYSLSGPQVHPYPYWGLLTEDGSDSAYGFAAFFQYPVTFDKESATMYFETSLAPTETNGLLTGIIVGPERDSICLCGRVYTPVPEPVTLVFLASGAAFVMRRKRN